MITGPSPFAQPIASPYAVNHYSQKKQEVEVQTQPREATLPRYVNYLADYSGCGHWRILWPESIINARGDGMSQSTTAMVTTPQWYQNVTAVKVQRQASTAQKEFIKFLKEVQKQHNFKIIYEVDDVVFSECIPDYNKFKFAFDNNEVRQNCIDIINMVDEVTVTCDFMKKLYIEKTGQKNITTIPNFVPNFWMGNSFNQRKIQRAFDHHKKKPRILYTGSGAHYDVDNKTNGVDDMYKVRDFIRKTVNKYQWVFVGAFPPQLADLVQSHKIEFYPWQNLLNYPNFIANLDAQMMIAPLLPNDFNKSKSDIKFIEACILGIPCLCQDIETYSSAPESLRFGSIRELEHKIERTLRKRNKYNQNISKLRKIGESRILELEENIGCHLEALNTPFGSPERKYLKKWN